MADRSFTEALEDLRTPRAGRVSRIGQPILRGRPGAIRAYDNKQRKPEYQNLLARLNELNPNVATSLERLDQRRLNRGQMPLTLEEAARGGAAAATRRATTPDDERDSILDIPSNAVRDLGQIVKSIPHLPGALVDEVRDLADGFTDDRAELTEQGRTGIAQLLSLPGIRMVPGTYAAANVLSGDVGELAEHPLLNVLDVLPIASRAARATPVVKAAEEAADVSRLQGMPTRPVRPLKTVATRRLDEAGDVVPNRAGQAVDRAMSTRPGMVLSTNFGQLARGGMRHLSTGEAEIHARAANPATGDRIGQIAQEWHKIAVDDDALAAKYDGMTRARHDEMWDVMSEGDTRVLSQLPEAEQRFVADIRALADEQAQHIARTTGELAQVDGEWFNAKDAKKLTGARDRMVKLQGEIFGSGQFEDVVRRRGGTRVTERVLNQGLMGDIDALAQVDPRWAEIKGHLDGGDMVAAGELARSFESADVRAASRRLNQLKNYGNEPTNVTDQRVFKVRSTLTKAANAEKGYAATRARINPARFDELINRKAGESMIRGLLDEGVITNADDAYRFLNEGYLRGIPGFDAAEWAKIRSATRNTWETLKAEGHDPVFMSRVDPRRAASIGHAKLDGTVPAMQTARKRVADVSPAIKSPSLAVTHQAFDIIRKEAGTRAAQGIMADYGRSFDQLEAEFLPLAQELAARNPNHTVLTALDDLISRRWTPFNPESMMPFAGGMTGAGTNRVYIPKQVADALTMANKEGFSKLRALNDPFTRLWRVSLLALSPRWHAYNMVGGAVMMSAEAGPQAFRHLGMARDIIKATREGTALPREIPRELQRQIGMMGREEAELALKQGGTARRLWEESRAAQAATKAGRKVVETSYDFNGMVDSAYKVMSYLEGESQALSRYKKMGYSDDEARLLSQQAGMETARKVLQDIGGQTPFERSVLRQVFPFYSWLSHLMRFAFNYPFDHPWRTAIVGAGSRIVMEDFGDAASIDMLDVFSWGEPDEKGERKSVRFGGLNPFSDTANLFTLAGWLGNTNPLFQTATQALGFDPRQGGIDLYPTLSYDPATGNLTVDAGNPVRNLAMNSIPHVATLARFAGMDQEFNELRRQDPATADRVLWSGVGSPLGAYRRYSREADYIGTELKRGEAKSETVSRSLKAGNLDALAPFLTPEQLEALKGLRDSGQLDAYLPPTEEEAA